VMEKYSKPTSKAECYLPFTIMRYCSRFFTLYPISHLPIVHFTFKKDLVYNLSKKVKL
jgi:hypothetical protein